jgi:hypothetical protein
MFFLPSRLEELSISILCLFNVSFRRFAIPLLECVKDVNALRESRHVEDSVFGARMNPNLLDAGPNGRNPLPVVRLESLLHPSKLEASMSSRPGWKRPDLVKRGPSQKRGLSTRNDYTNIDMSQSSTHRRKSHSHGLQRPWPSPFSVGCKV